MKKIAMRSLAILLSVTPFVHAQQIANVLPKNHGEMLQPLTEATFNPDQPTDVPQDFISYAMGTDVRSTSLRPDRPTDVPQDFISYAMGTDVRSTSLRPDRPTDVPQDFSSYAMGTDVRSTSPRPDRPTDVPQDFSSYAMGTGTYYIVATVGSYSSTMGYIVY